jgi:hypothetical protein
LVFIPKSSKQNKTNKTMKKQKRKNRKREKMKNTHTHSSATRDGSHNATQQRTPLPNHTHTIQKLQQTLNQFLDKKQGWVGGKTNRPKRKGGNRIQKDEKSKQKKRQRPQETKKARRSGTLLLHSQQSHNPHYTDSDESGS